MSLVLGTVVKYAKECALVTWQYQVHDGDADDDDDDDDDDEVKVELARLMAAIGNETMYCVYPKLFPLLI